MLSEMLSGVLLLMMMIAGLRLLLLLLLNMLQDGCQGRRWLMLMMNAGWHYQVIALFRVEGKCMGAAALNFVEAGGGLGCVGQGASLSLEL